MKKSLLIVGAGPGISAAVAKKFGNEGFQIGLISRSIENLRVLSSDLQAQGLEILFEVADAGNTSGLEQAISNLISRLGTIDLLIYNAATLKQRNILDETANSLMEDFNVNVANALTAVKTVMSDLKKNKGTVILTGGGFAFFPSPQYGSISIGKAGIRSLAYQLKEALEPHGIHVGTVTVKGFIDEADDVLNSRLVAEEFYKLFHDKESTEVQYP